MRSLFSAITATNRSEWDPPGRSKTGSQSLHNVIKAAQIHILFLTDNFPPEVNAPASRTFEHCREWARNGCEVTVITTAPNFPLGRVYPNHSNKLWQSEVIDGVRVIRVWSYIAPNAGFVRRTLDYVSYMLAATIAALFVRRVDIIVATSPQFFTAMGGFLVGTLKRRPWVFELRDLWPESIKSVGLMRDGLIYKTLVSLEGFLYRRATAIICVTEPFRQRLISNGIDAAKISVITNGVELEQFSPRAKPCTLVERYGLAGRFVAGYVGTHGMAHGLETLIEAAALLADDDKSEHICILFLGDGAEKEALIASARARSLQNVVFVDSVPKQQVADHWALLDVSIVHLKKDDLFKTVIPSKIFESMAMGLPLVLGVEGEAARIVSQEDAGLLVEPGDPVAMASAIRTIADNAAKRRTLSENAVAAAARYDRRRLARLMQANLSEIASGQAPSRAAA